jgi:uncharacterized membrane protein YqhA
MNFPNWLEKHPSRGLFLLIGVYMGIIIACVLLGFLCVHK